MGTDHKIIRSGGPLRLIGGFMQVFQEIFHTDQNMPWVWYANDARQAPIVDPKNKPRTRVYILAGYDEVTAVPDAATRIVVNKGSTVTSKVAYNLHDQENGQLISLGHRYMYYTSQTDIEIRVFAQVVGECYQLIDLVQAVIGGTQIEIANFLHVNELSETVTTSVQKVVADRTEYTAALSLRVTHEERYFRAPDALTLRKIQFSAETVPAGETAEMQIIVPSE